MSDLGVQFDPKLRAALDLIDAVLNRNDISNEDFFVLEGIADNIESFINGALE